MQLAHNPLFLRGLLAFAHSEDEAGFEWAYALSSLLSCFSLSFACCLACRFYIIRSLFEDDLLPILWDTVALGCDDAQAASARHTLIKLLDAFAHDRVTKVDVRFVSVTVGF